MAVKQTDLFNKRPKLNASDKAYLKLLKSGVALQDHIYPTSICKDIYRSKANGNQFTLDTNNKLIKRANQLIDGCYYHLDSNLIPHRYEAWIMTQILKADHKKYSPSKLDKSFVKRLLIDLKID